MVNETALKDALLLLVQDVKSQYLSSFELMAEVSAIRATVRPLDPAFQEVLNQKRLEITAENAPIVESVIRGYDELIRKLKAGEVC